MERVRAFSACSTQIPVRDASVQACGVTPGGQVPPCPVTPACLPVSAHGDRPLVLSEGLAVGEAGSCQPGLRPATSQASSGNAIPCTGQEPVSGRCRVPGLTAHPFI